MPQELLSAKFETAKTHGLVTHEATHPQGHMLHITMSTGVGHLVRHHDILCNFNVASPVGLKLSLGAATDSCFSVSKNANPLSGTFRKKVKYTLGIDINFVTLLGHEQLL